MAQYWIDTSAISAAVKSDGDLNLALRTLSQTSTLLIVPKVRDEIFSGNPLTGGEPMTPQMIAIFKRFLQILDVEFDYRGSTDDRRKIFELQFFNKNGRSGVRAIEESDAMILSQVRASANERKVEKPILVVSDGRLSRCGDTKFWNVEVTKLPSFVATARTRTDNFAKVLEPIIDGISREYDRLSQQHQMQIKMTLSPSIVNFEGFWVNRLFNNNMPSLDIWNPVYSSLMSVRFAMKVRRFELAAARLMVARGELLKATMAYLRWTDGIEQAAPKLKIAIGFTAASLILLAVTGYIAIIETPVAAEMADLNQLFEQSNVLAMRVAAESSGPSAEAALAEWEASIDKMQEMIQEALSQ